MLRRTLVDQAYTRVPELPEIRPALGWVGPMEWAWDGSRVYQVGFSEARKRVVSIGTPLWTSSGERRWFWTEPKVLDLGSDALTLLGAWEDSLLFLQTKLDATAKVESRPGPRLLAHPQNLLKVDLLTGAKTRLLDLPGGNHYRRTTLFAKGAFYVFTDLGLAIRVAVSTEPWGAEILASNFWVDAGITLCKETGEFRNPFLFGKAFFDLDGSILIPTQVFLPSDRSDLDLAWSKLSQVRKAELVRTGFWPVPGDKEVGWKDDVRFLRFDPTTKAFKQVDRLWYEHLVLERDMNFMIQQFKDMDADLVYTSSGGKIRLLEATLKEAEAARAASSKEEPATGMAPSSKADPARQTSGKQPEPLVPTKAH